MKFRSDKQGVFKLVLAAAVIGIFGFAILISVSLWQERISQTEHARKEVENITGVIEAHALMTIQKVGLVLQDVKGHAQPEHMVQISAPHDHKSTTLYPIIQDRLSNIPEISVINIANTAGDIIHSTHDGALMLNISDQNFFKTHRNNPDAGLVFSHPLQSRILGTWAVTLSRRINFPDGSFAGVVLAPIDLNYFNNFYATLDMGQHGAVLLRDREMRLYARHPMLESGMGTPIPNHPVITQFLSKGIERGVYIEISPADSIKRIYSFRRVGSHPLYVLAAIAEEDYLLEWQQHLAWYGIAAVLIAALSIGMALIARIGMIKQKAAEDELAQYHEHLEQLVAERTKALAQAQKMAATGQLAAGVAHEINNPLGFIISNLTALERYAAELLELTDAYQATEAQLPAETATELAGKRQKADLPFLREDISTLLHETRNGACRVRDIVQDLRSFASGEDEAFERIDLHQLIDSTVDTVWKNHAHEVQIQKVYGDLSQVECMPTQIGLALNSILLNAIQFIDGPGKITIQTRIDGEWVKIAISDTGIGMTPEVIEKIFDPFFTTRPVGSGVGLGLSVVHGIVERHGGKIDVASKPGTGSVFTIRLPLRH